METGILFSIINVITEGLQRTAPALAINRAFLFAGEGNLFRVAVGVQLSKQNNTLREGGTIRGPMWRQGPGRGRGRARI